MTTSRKQREPFSRKLALEKAITTRIRQTKLKAKLGNQDMKLKHPDWVKDAKTDNYVILIQKVTDETKKQQLRNETFVRKLHEDG